MATVFSPSRRERRVLTRRTGSTPNRFDPAQSGTTEASTNATSLRSHSHAVDGWSLQPACPESACGREGSQALAGGSRWSARPETAEVHRRVLAVLAFLDAR